MTAVSSTSRASSKYLRSSSNRRSGTAAGVPLIPSAYSRTSFSTGEKAELFRKRGSARSWSSVIPKPFPSIEPMSTQNSADDECHLHLGEFLQVRIHQAGAVERELHGARAEEHVAVVRRHPHRLGNLAEATPGEPVREAPQ